MKICSQRRDPWLWAVTALILFAAACAPQGDGSWQGYVEGDYVTVAAPLGGQLERLSVARGGCVAQGDELFVLESVREAAVVDAAGHEARRARGRLADLTKGGRPSEIAALEASLADARFAMDLAAKELERRQGLWTTGVIAQEELDVARTDFERKGQAVRRVEAELATARLGGREDEIAAARAEVDAAQAALDQARWSLDQKRQAAPVAATVTDTLYEPGEYVPAGSPVVELLPPGNVKVRFFVPEALVGTLVLGQTVSVSWDGAPGPLAARVSYIAPEAEFTPPVIYSSQSRAKLVFMVEARPQAPGGDLVPHPGQPVDVLPQASPGTGRP